MDRIFPALVLSTLFLIGLFLLSKVIVRRFGTMTGKQGRLRVTEKLSLSPERFLYVVELQGKQYVLVSDKAGTVLLDTRTDLELPPFSDDLERSSSEKKDSFVGYLNKLKREKDA